MSHLGSSDLCKGEKNQSYVNNQTPQGYIANKIERYNSLSHDANHPESLTAKVLEDAKHRHDQEQYRTVTGGSRHSDYLSREPMNPASAVSHPAAVPSATAIYPRVALVSQHPRPAGPSPHFEGYGLPSHLPPNPPPTSRSHHTPVHSQTYRHLLPPHTLIPGQYSNSGTPHIGLDMWQKYNPNPWIMTPQYDEFRMREREERERAINQEREREQGRVDRQKEERAEKERRDWQEQERLDREERERAQREAVQQHFEESLRLALQKQQQQQKNAGWSPVAASKPSGKERENNLTVNMPSNQVLRDTDRMRDREKERTQISENHDKWMAMMQQQQRTEQSASITQLQNFASSESRGVRNKEAHLMSVHGPSKSNLAPSPISSSSQMKHETNFSLYGYQPFQHTYITHAQLKAREESKAAANIQSVRVPSNQMKTGMPLKGDKDSLESPVSPGSGHSGSHISATSSKHQLKVHHPSQERSSPMYQPLGSGGAFKPYEYSSNSCSPAPPAHQNTSPSLGRIGTPQYQVQDQPQNLVKSDGKTMQERTNSGHKLDSRDPKQMLSSVTSASCFTPSYTNSKSLSPAANTTHSLIQQGLVPNPLYIAATHTGNSANSSLPPSSFTHSQTSTKPVHSGSPPVSQQYVHMSPNSGINSGTPVCRPSSVPYTLPPGRSNRSYSPVAPPLSLPANMNNKAISSHDLHMSNRAHISVQSGSHRSPSPAHMYGTQSNSGAPSSPHQSSPRMTSVSNHPPVHLSVSNTISSSPFHSSSQPDSQDMSVAVVPLVKRKLLNDVIPRKRPKSVDDGLLPPQLLPQVQTSNIESVESQVVTPPNLVSNVTVLTDHQQGSESHPVISDPPSPMSSSSLSYKSEASVLPPTMPELLNITSNISSESELSAGAQNYSLTKYKIPSKVYVSGSSVEENTESSNCTLGVSEKTTDNTTTADINEEQASTTPAVSNSSITPITSSYHTKLKKAWLQRHSENEDKKNPSDPCIENKTDVLLKTEPDDIVNEICIKTEPYVVLESSVCDEVLNESKLKICEDSSSDVSENRTNKSDRALEDSSSSESDTEQNIKNGKRKTKNRKSISVSIKRGKTGNNSDVANDDQPSPKKDKDGKKKAPEKTTLSAKKRGRKKMRNAVVEESKKKTLAKSITSKPPEKPSISQLKKTGEPFLQDGPCCEVAPRLPKCRECRMTPNQRNKKMPNIFCRFYAYRKLRYGKNGTILSAGFSEPSDASADDFKLWLPPVDSPPADIEIETSKFLLTHIGDQFCDLVEMEKEAQKMHMANDGTVTWKRVVQGVREMCDVCETTLFNIHWVCHKCGFVVCIDCYKFRKSTKAKDEVLSKDRDGYQWLMCSNRQPHEQEKLMLTQIIAGTSLWDLGKTLHDIRKKWNIPTYCSCKSNDNDQDSKSSSNGICKLMSAVTKCFSSDKESSRDANGSDSSRPSRRSGKSSVNGVLKQEDTLGGYSSESGGSPLSWLADVALNSSSKISDDQKDKDDDEKSSEDQDSCPDASLDSDDEKSENFSTLRELLIRPTGKMGGKNSGSSSSSQKTLTSTLDEVISCVIEQKVRKSDKKCKEKQLLHFTRRYQMSRSGRELPPIRTCNLGESSLLYPEIPHIWLGNGKILLLKDPSHSGNLQLFQEQWKRGQPVIVADVGTKLNPSLWNPESFIKEFGDVKSDFLNCLGGTLLPNQPLKKFWEGFENANKRIKGDDGESLVLKMLDWPPGDEFSDVMPSRFDDFMKILPLRQYTHREGILNMASRLPDCFVQPDLGPRMYNAYGISSLLGKGSTNLHLDVSDAINVLAYVAVGKDDISSDILKVLEDSGCDSLMRKRARERGSKPGAIWHVFNARDADKIRDFLNKVSEEQGVKLNPHHDPIHNQEWYLDDKMRNRLFKEYGVEAYTIAQYSGDAIFIPAGSPHQVQNIFSCIVISEDFVSPESVGHSFFLTQEIRNLSDTPINHEDKLQIKNIIYHAVKDALALLQSNDPEDSKM